MATKQLQVVITGDDRGVRRALTQVGADIDRVDKKTSRSSDLWAKHGAAIRRGAAVGAAAVVAGAAASIKAAIDWETALAGVAKTVDGTDAQIEALGDGIVAMANRMPASREEIAGVAEAAGQLGVQREDVLGFTETMIGMGQATNLASEDAATGLARMMNIMGTAPDEVERLASTIVDLGNNAATTESEILDMSLRLAGAGQLIGATESDVLALSATMSSLGIEAERGGGAMTRILLMIDKAAKEGGDTLDGFASTAGMSAAEFAAAWEADPVRATDALLQGLARIDASGGNVVAVLEDMGIKGTQNTTVMLSLLGAGDLLTESLDRANAAWGKNNALSEEVAKRYGTAESQLAIFRNQVTNVGREIGGVLVPGLLLAVDYARSAGEWLGDRLPAALEVVLPIWDDLYGAGENVVDILDQLVDTGRPVAEVLAAIGGAAVIGALAGTAASLEAITSFLADNDWAVRAVIATTMAWAGLQAWPLIVGAIETIYVRWLLLQGAVTGSTIYGGLQMVAGGFLTMGTNAQVGAGMVRQGMGTIAGSTAVATAGLALVAYAGISAWQGYGKAVSAAEDLADTLIDVKDAYDSAGMEDSIRRVTRELEVQREEWHEYDGIGGILQGTLEVLTPLENKVLDNAAAVRVLSEEQAKLEGQQARLNQITSVLGSTFGISREQGEGLLRALDIDLEQTRFEDVIAGVNDELNKLAGQDPKTDAIVGAMTVVADETQSTTDKVDAFRKALDEVFAPDQDYHDAVISYVEGFNEIKMALAIGAGELDVWSEKGREVQSQASSFFDTVKDRAGAAVADLVAGGVQFDDAVRLAAAGVAESRGEFIGLGEDAGYTREQMEELLASLGWTEDSIDLILALQGGEETQEGLREIERAAEEAGRERRVHVDVDDSDAVGTMGTLAQGFAEFVEINPTTEARVNAADPIGKIAFLEEQFALYARANPTAAAWLNSLPAEQRQQQLALWLAWYDSRNVAAGVALSDTERVERELANLTRNRDVQIFPQLMPLRGQADPDYIGLADRRWGGIHEVARWGRIPAHVAHDPTILYGERETGGEAMIPRFGRSAQSLRILEKAASWYGATVVPKDMATAKAAWPSGPASARPSQPATAPVAQFQRPVVIKVDLDGREIARSKPFRGEVAKWRTGDRVARQ